MLVDYRRSNVTVGLVCGPLRPGGCSPVSPALWRSVGVLREPVRSVPFGSKLVLSLNTLLTSARIRIQLGASLRGNGICSASIGTSPFTFLFVPNLTGRLCCSAVAIVLSRRSRPPSWRHTVMAASRPVSHGPVSPPFHHLPVPVFDTHRLRSPSSSSRCRSDGFPGLCVSLPYVLYMHTVVLNEWIEKSGTQAWTQGTCVCTCEPLFCVRLFNWLYQSCTKGGDFLIHDLGSDSESGYEGANTLFAELSGQ